MISLSNVFIYACSYVANQFQYHQDILTPAEALLFATLALQKKDKGTLTWEVVVCVWGCALLIWNHVPYEQQGFFPKQLADPVAINHWTKLSKLSFA